MLHLRSFLPPIIYKLKPRRKERIYQNFSEALEDSHTYEDPGVIEVVVEKTKRYRSELEASMERNIQTRQALQNAFVVSKIYSGHQINVLEVGGACGAAFFELEYLLPGYVSRWNVVETRGMTEAAKVNFQSDRLFFCQDFNEATQSLEPLDMVMASGVIQYLEKPIKTLKSILERGFPYVYLSRTLVSKDLEKKVFVKQKIRLSDHGPGEMPEYITDRETSQPMAILPYSELMDCTKANYSTLFLFLESPVYSIALSTRNINVFPIGLLMRRVED